MKLLSTLTAVCTCLTAYTSVALAAETAVNAATESADPSVSGMLPAAEKSDAEPAADKDVSSSTAGASKGREAKNAIYLDLFGPGLLYSINYDREIIPDLSGRIGLSYFSIGASASAGSGASAAASLTYWAIPLTANYLGIGSENNMFEVGGGPVIMHAKISGSGVLATDETTAGGTFEGTLLAMTGHAGYRHQPADGGFLFRIGLSPFISTKLGFLPWGYLSLGAAF